MTNLKENLNCEIKELYRNLNSFPPLEFFGEDAMSLFKEIGGFLEITNRRKHGFIKRNDWLDFKNLYDRLKIINETRKDEKFRIYDFFTNW